jgi:DinB superfamily
VELSFEGGGAMSDSPAQSTREVAMARLDDTRAAFLAAFAEVPDEALAYVPVGDEYALGVLPMHLQDPLRDYMDVLERALGAQFAPVDLSADAARAEAGTRRHAELVAQRPGGADRARMLGDLETAHRDARSRLAALDEATFTRAAPVTYSPGADPYPTSALAICGWLADHYQEHAAQTKDLLGRWRAEQGQ